MQTERWINVWKVARNDHFPDFNFWVYYVVHAKGEWEDGTKFGYAEHAGSRVIKAVDELAMYQEFCKQMQKRHEIEPNNVRWSMNNETAED